MRYETIIINNEDNIAKYSDKNFYHLIINFYHYINFNCLILETLSKTLQTLIIIMKI